MNFMINLDIKKSLIIPLKIVDFSDLLLFSTNKIPVKKYFFFYLAITHFDLASYSFPCKMHQVFQIVRRLKFTEVLT